MGSGGEISGMSLEAYRERAEVLLAAARAGDAVAMGRMGPLAEPTATDAERAIAREQGFLSWAELREFAEASGVGRPELVEEFIDAAVADLGLAEARLGAHPGLAGGGFYVDLVLGNAQGVRRFLADAPAMALVASGPQQCEPLLYVCFSRYARGGTERAGAMVETARQLLRYGADANAAFTSEDAPESPLSCLYAATGLNNNAGLGRALLEAGAKPDDGESLYHSTEHRDLECVRLLLEHGATVAGPQVLNHMLDGESVEGVRLLLGAGADPNGRMGRGETSLHWAVRRGRTAAVIRLLLEADAEVDARREDGRTGYALAVASGQREVAELLEARGAQTELPRLDAFLGACAVAGPDELERLLAQPPAVTLTAAEDRLLGDLTAMHATAAVRALLAVGVPVNALGEHGATPLHWACWHGFADLLEVLLARGASLTAEDAQFHGTPGGWYAHGLNACGGAGGDYAQVARLLLGAGAAIPATDLPMGRRRWMRYCGSLESFAEDEDGQVRQWRRFLPIRLGTQLGYVCVRAA